MDVQPNILDALQWCRNLPRLSFKQPHKVHALPNRESTDQCMSMCQQSVDVLKVISVMLKQHCLGSLFVVVLIRLFALEFLMMEVKVV